jgi:hypothetical protein
MPTNVGRSGTPCDVGRGSGGSGCWSIGGAARSQCTHPHLMSVHLLRWMAWRMTAIDAAQSETNIPSSVGVQDTICIVG